MSISERDIKLLWGRAAGRCSICKVPVTENEETRPGAIVLGEAAHIVADKPSGPRGGFALPENLRDSYWNLILVCPTCHTRIDKAETDYSVERLHQLKHFHEAEIARLHPPDKDSYDQELHFSTVTEENWLSADRKNYIPFGVERSEWIAPFLQPRLATSVPMSVIRAFEVARAAMIYSWFFYPLASLGTEQVMRVGKLAIREKCQSIGSDAANFETELIELVEAGHLTHEMEARWLALGHLCNDRNSLAGPTLFDPGQAISTLRLIADMINPLFDKQASSSS